MNHFQLEGEQQGPLHEYNCGRYGPPNKLPNTIRLQKLIHLTAIPMHEDGWSNFAQDSFIQSDTALR